MNDCNRDALNIVPSGGHNSRSRHARAPDVSVAQVYSTCHCQKTISTVITLILPPRCLIHDYIKLLSRGFEALRVGSTAADPPIYLINPPRTAVCNDCGARWDGLVSNMPNVILEKNAKFRTAFQRVVKLRYQAKSALLRARRSLLAPAVSGRSEGCERRVLLCTTHHLI